MSSRRRSILRLARPAAVFALSVALSVTVVFGVIGIVLPRTAPPVAVPQAFGPPLSKHVALIIIDGLRYDIATNSELMPHFASEMKRCTSGEMWSGRISVTSAAVLSYGTAQRGRTEQVVRNLRSGPSPYNSWLQNAHQAGLVLSAVGGAGWAEMYGPYFRAHRPGPPGVSLEVDFNPQTLRDARALLAGDPAFLVVHFVSPDHQAHAHGIRSARYLAHIRELDQRLSEFLNELGSDWTVIVSSDHGCLEDGSHGWDTPEQRRSPIYARGPGIAPGVRSSAPLDQIDLASTLAALLGVPPPAHGVGVPIVEWLDVPSTERARVACESAKNVVQYADSVLDRERARSASRELELCREGISGPERVSAARSVAHRIDSEILAATGITSRAARAMAWILAALAVLVACAAAGRRVLGSLPFALALGAIAIWLTRDTELLPGIWPNCVRAVCFSIPALLVLGLLVFPTRGGRLLDAYPAIAPIFIPGLLVASYTTNTQPLAYAASIAGAVFFTIRSRPLRSAGPTLVAVFLLGSSLWRAGTQRGNVFPAWLADAPATATSVALLAILAWSSWQMLRNRHDLIALAVALGAAIASLLLRDRAEPSAARVALTVLPLLCVLAALGGRKSLALHLGLAGYLWVSRSAELPGLLATLALAELVGLALARSKAELDRTELLLLTAFAFGLLFVQRVAIQGGLDWNSLDLRAGAFGDPVVPAWLVGTALTWKYLLAELLGLFALLMGVETELSERLGPALLLVYLGRTTALVGMLIFCGTSFWTGVRVTSDLPFAVLGLPLASLVWIAARSAESARRAERARSPLEEQAEAQTKNASIPAARTDQ